MTRLGVLFLKKCFFFWLIIRFLLALIISYISGLQRGAAPLVPGVYLITRLDLENELYNCEFIARVRLILKQHVIFWSRNVTSIRLAESRPQLQNGTDSTDSLQTTTMVTGVKIHSKESQKAQQELFTEGALRFLVALHRDRKSTRLNSSHCVTSRMPSSA